MPRTPKVSVVYLVTLDCKHALEFDDVVPPRKGDEHWCRRCRRLRTVEAAPPQYKVRCRGCRYTRTFGRARVTAEVAAAKHRRRNPEHTIEVRDGHVVVQVFHGVPEDPYQTSLEHAFDSAPPF